VGGKALGLALLVSCGLPVPPALVVETDAYDLALRADPSFARFPRKVESMLVAAHDRMRERAGGPLAVRSSATVEDLRASSFAG
jgi:pyruvate,water dikinase